MSSHDLSANEPNKRSDRQQSSQQQSPFSEWFPSHVSISHILSSIEPLSPQRVTPSAILNLQRTVGNAAVKNLIAQTKSSDQQPHTEPDDPLEVFSVLQRAPASQPQILQNTAQIVLQAIARNLQLGKTMSAKAPPAMLNTVGSRYEDLLWEWALIARGKVEKDGVAVSIHSEMLLTHIDNAIRETMPLINALNPEDELVADWLEEFFYSRVNSLRAAALAQQADEEVSAAASSHGQLLDPVTSTHKEETRSLVRQAMDVNADLGNLIDAFDDAVAKQIARDMGEALPSFGIDTPDGIRKDLSKLAPREVVSTLGTVLGALNDILDLTDPAAMKALFNKRLGVWGQVQGISDLVAKALSIVQGTIAASCSLMAVVCRVTGYGKQAMELFRVGSNLSSAMGFVGKVVGALSILKGTISLVHPQSTFAERAEGLADIAMGVGAIAGGTAGFLLFAGTAYVRLSAHIIQEIGKIPGIALRYELQRSYKDMIEHGMSIARHANEAIQGQKLIAAESDPEKKAALQQRVKRSVDALRGYLKELLRTSGNAGTMQYYRCLRKRFNPLGPPPSPSTPVQDLIKQAGLALEIMQTAIVDFEQVGKEAKQELLDKL